MCSRLRKYNMQWPCQSKILVSMSNTRREHAWRSRLKMLIHNVWSSSNVLISMQLREWLPSKRCRGRLEVGRCPHWRLPFLLSSCSAPTKFQNYLGIPICVYWTDWFQTRFIEANVIQLPRILYTRKSNLVQAAVVIAPEGCHRILAMLGSWC